MDAAKKQLDPLPARWVVRLFDRLFAKYGQTFWAQYAGRDSDEVLIEWANELGCTRECPQVITQALERCGAQPPSAKQFRELCMPPVDVPPPIKPTPVALPKVQAGDASTTDFRQWARVLRAREQRGEVLSLAQRDAWRAALKREDSAHD